MTGPDAAVELALQFQALSAHLQAGDLDDILDRLVGLARDSVDGSDSAALTEWPERRPPRTLACTGDVAAAVDAIQYATSEGPCLDAAADTELVLSRDLAAEERWPQFCKRVLAETPVRAILSVSLIDRSPRCALNLYAAHSGAFVAEELATATLFAAHARVLFAQLDAENRAANLTQALSTSRMIGAAVGILMSAHKVTAEQAFDMLRASSQNLHRKLRLVALEVTDTGELPPPPSHRREP